MLGGGNQYARLKTNLRLALNRLKLLEKKKSELAQKARREIAEYLASGKEERARIRVEHIIREDYLVEAMEMLEMYCDLLLARFGLLEQMKTMDEGLEEAITSIIWATPRLQSDIAELKVITEQLTAKFGKQYVQAVKENQFNTVNDKLIRKLSVQAPKRLLVEQYLIEIAKSHKVPYEPDPRVMSEEAGHDALLDFAAADSIAGSVNRRPPGAGSGGAGSGGGFGAAVGSGSLPSQSLHVEPPPPMYPQTQSFRDYENNNPLDASSSMERFLRKDFEANENHNVDEPTTPTAPPPAYESPRDPGKPVPQPRMHMAPVNPPAPPSISDLPELPSVPHDDDESPQGKDDDHHSNLDFEDLNRRFENLKKKK
ncbi:IST1 homolog [Paramacrobiotus metropolitanus]|uniref:IST1 homolog n=1 Tax=Paramacrobiotus metropolitanus TaxID=2943436 RepID=UPI0024461163|nr:IST1 homolog [Paramacrobiotus metropolitanus]XP_055357999.1 IST1 homolog [Paramacrobiotus metropolitanus]XP_055358000.1 IST1 homolog [Paramacrobiotus metropolitanus]XP_055358001.1 IST1 homolog [Paramacrobiotus metropolitanus]